MSKTDGGLRQLFRKYLPRIHWQTIEAPAVGKGIPDCNGCGNGQEFWVENKRALNTGVIGLRPEQVAWLSRRGRAGGYVYIAVREQRTRGPRRGPGCDTLWVLDGTQAKYVNELKTLAAVAQFRPDLVLGVWEGGPARWQWHEVGFLFARARFARRSKILDRKQQPHST